MRFDLAVIGGGPAGYTAAVRAAKRGMTVLLAEGGETGGTCLNRGCIPTKCLLRSSELFASRAEWENLGVRAENVRFDETAVYARKDETVAGLRGGIETLLKSCSVTTVKARVRVPRLCPSGAANSRSIPTECLPRPSPRAMLS